jgi:DNA (cytosine-5)-methyltransferase 1
MFTRILLLLALSLCCANGLEVKQTYDCINGRAKKDYTEKRILAWYNKLHNDGAEYKMWGNGIALPCALFVMEGIIDAAKGD